MPTLEKELWQSPAFLRRRYCGLADAGKGTVAKHAARALAAEGSLADAGKGTVAKLRLMRPLLAFSLADAGKGTVAKRLPLIFTERLRLADAGKGTVAKPLPSRERSLGGLADAGKGTVAKLKRGGKMELAVLPTLEKELWQSRCVELYDNALSYVKFLSQD